MTITGSRWPSALAAVALGACPIAASLLGHGSNGRRGLIILLATSLVLVGISRFDVLSGAQRLAATACLIATAGVLIVPSLGRSPLPLVLLGTLLAEEAVHGLPLPRRRPPAVQPLTVLAVIGFGAAWLRTESPSAAGLIWMVGLIFVAIGRRSRISEELGARISEVMAATAETGRVASARFLGAVARWSGRAWERLRSWVGAGWSSMRVALRDPMVRRGLYLSIFAALIVAPLFPRIALDPHTLVRGTNDIPGTIERVHWMQLWPFRMPVPHPTWSVLAKVLLPILGQQATVTVLLSVATGITVGVIFAIARARWDDLPPLRWPAAASLAIGWVLLENPGVLSPTGDNWWNRSAIAGEFARGPALFPIHLWATPTIIVSMPLVFATFYVLLATIDAAVADHPSLRSRRRVLMALTIVLTITQPATTLALVPATPVFLLVTGRLSARSFRSVLWAFMVPGTAIVLAQVAFLASNVSPWEQATWLWRPLWVWNHFGLDRPAFWAVFAIYPICLWAGGRRYLADPAVGLSGLGIIVSAGPFLFLEQTTISTYPDGDLGVPLTMAHILLFFASLRFLLVEAQTLYDRRSTPAFRLPSWAFAAAIFVFLALCAGIMDLAMARGLIHDV